MTKLAQDYLVGVKNATVTIDNTIGCIENEPTAMADMSTADAVNLAKIVTLTVQIRETVDSILENMGKETPNG